MTIKVTYIHNGNSHTEIMTGGNPTSGPARLFIKYPQLNKDNTTIVSSIGFCSSFMENLDFAEKRTTPPLI